MKARVDKIGGEERFREHFCFEISEIFKKLITRKHIYQNATFETDFLEKLAKEFDALPKSTGSGAGFGHAVFVQPLASRLKNEFDDLVKMPWVPETLSVPPAPGSRPSKDKVLFIFPIAQLYCGNCKDDNPHHVLKKETQFYENLMHPTNQWYFFAYECQGCKEARVRFFVSRNKEKLKLVGRDPMEEIQVPPAIPKAFKKMYSDSMLAFQSGQTLAALFLLRVFIEQFWMSISKVSQGKKNSRSSGEEMARAYNKTLSAKFTGVYPSLGEVYDLISAAMHEGKSDEELFKLSCQKIVNHFEGKKVFEEAQILKGTNA